MQISVEETLSNGGNVRYSIIVGEEDNKMIAAEMIEYKAEYSDEYMMVLPKVINMTVEEKYYMRGTFMERFVNYENENEYVFEIPTWKIFRMRSDAWFKAESIIEAAKS